MFQLAGGASGRPSVTQSSIPPRSYSSRSAGHPAANSAAVAWAVAVHCGPLQNTTVGSTGSSSAIRCAISPCGMFDRAWNRAAIDVLGQPAVDQRPPGAQVLDHLELPDRPNAGG
jgi:hypothetical protein